MKKYLINVVKGFKNCLHSLTSTVTSFAHRALAFLFAYALPFMASAQDASGGVSTALNDWGKYLLWGTATVVAMVGAAVNMEKIIDKEGTGTRQQGIQNLAVIILFCLVAVAAVQFVSSQFNSLSF